MVTFEELHSTHGPITWVCPECTELLSGDTPHDIGVLRTGHLAEHRALRKLEAANAAR